MTRATEGKTQSYSLALKHQRLALDLYHQTPKWQIKKRERRYNIWWRNALKVHHFEALTILESNNS